MRSQRCRLTPVLGAHGRADGHVQRGPGPCPRCRRPRPPAAAPTARRAALSSLGATSQHLPGRSRVSEPVASSALAEHVLHASREARELLGGSSRRRRSSSSSSTRSTANGRPSRSKRASCALIDRVHAAGPSSRRGPWGSSRRSWISISAPAARIASATGRSRVCAGASHPGARSLDPGEGTLARAGAGARARSSSTITGPPAAAATPSRCPPTTRPCAIGSSRPTPARAPHARAASIAAASMAEHTWARRSPSSQATAGPSDRTAAAAGRRAAPPTARRAAPPPHRRAQPRRGRRRSPRADARRGRPHERSAFRVPPGARARRRTAPRAAPERTGRGPRAPAPRRGTSPIAAAGRETISASAQPRASSSPRASSPSTESSAMGLARGVRCGCGRSATSVG